MDNKHQHPLIRSTAHQIIKEENLRLQKSIKTLMSTNNEIMDVNENLDLLIKLAASTPMRTIRIRQNAADWNTLVKLCMDNEKQANNDNSVNKELHGGSLSISDCESMLISPNTNSNAEQPSLSNYFKHTLTQKAATNNK